MSALNGLEIWLKTIPYASCTLFNSDSEDRSQPEVEFSLSRFNFALNKGNPYQSGRDFPY
jgi:hypothetical protein